MLKVFFLSLSVFFLVGCGNVSETEVKIDYVHDSLTVMYMDDIKQLDALSSKQVELLRADIVGSSFSGDSDTYNFYIVLEITSDKNLKDYFKRNLSTEFIDSTTGSMAVKKSNNTYYVFANSQSLYFKDFFTDASYSLSLDVEFYYNDSNDVGLFADSVNNSSNKITILKDDLSNLLDSFGIPYNVPRE